MYIVKFLRCGLVVKVCGVRHGSVAFWLIALLVARVTGWLGSGLAEAMALCPSTQVDVDSTQLDGMQVKRYRLTYGQACALTGQDHSHLNLPGMVTVKRRRFEQVVTDKAEDLLMKEDIQQAVDQGIPVLDLVGKTITRGVGSSIGPTLIVAPTDSLVRWQVMIMAAGRCRGEIWADLQDLWSVMLDVQYHRTEDWKDAMWDRAEAIDALPCVCRALGWVHRRTRSSFTNTGPLR